MTEADQQTIDQIEADRRKRERELLLLLMLLTDDSRKHAQSAIRLGVDPVNAARNVIMGASRISQPGGAGGIAGVMLNSYADGVNRVFKMAGLPTPPFTREPGVMPRLQEVDVVDLTPAQRAYDAWAVTTTQGLYRQIAEKIVKALTADYNADVNARVRAIRDTLTKAGLTRVNPSSLERMATTAVLRAYADGYGDGWSNPAIRIKLRGFKYVSVIDEKTTPICRAYDGIQLPADDIWWKSHAPPNHWNCRATYRPIWRDFEPSTLIPDIEPEPGWGNSAISPLMPYQLTA